MIIKVNVLFSLKLIVFLIGQQGNGVAETVCWDSLVLGELSIDGGRESDSRAGSGDICHNWQPNWDTIP